MSVALRPVLLRPVYKDYLWGGGRIARVFGRAGAPEPCAESWECSAHPDGMSVVDGGPFDGRALDSLCEEFGRDLLGSWCEDGRFPLLVKIIDASQRLSVQVHPNEESAPRLGGEPKTEAWYFIDAEPGASVCAGLKSGVGPRIFADALKERRVPTLLRSVAAVPGKALFIPGGLVHAIGEGCFVLEVQQSSNTTYRVYDWDRVGPDGKPRELHTEKAARAIDWKLGAVDLSTPVPMHAVGRGNVRDRIVHSDFFTIERFVLRAPEPVDTSSGGTFRILFAAAGSVSLFADGDEAEEPILRLPFGRTCLVPACARGISVVPDDADVGATILAAGL